MDEAYVQPRDPRAQPVDLGRGTDQSGVRQYNERLVLSLIRQRGSIPKADLSRLTGLSAQTVSVIVNQLEADGLVLKGARTRGRIGQPSVPYALNPEGALSFGLKIGRRSADLVLIDFAGKMRRHLHLRYAYPLPSTLLTFATAGVRQLTDELTPAHRAKIVGVGIATPYELWNWSYEVGGPTGALDVWRDFDLRAAFQLEMPFPVFLCNDATAACAAELIFGRDQKALDFLYIFIGSFVGGGLVLNGMLMAGRSGNAGALGSMPIPDSQGRVQQLIRTASLYKLEARLVEAGKKTGWLWDEPDAWEEAGSELDVWIAEASASLAYAATSAAAVIDFQAVVLDGAFPTRIKTRMVDAVQDQCRRFDRQGLSPMRIQPGAIGPAARELGAGSLPLIANFALDRDVLLKEDI